MATIRLLAACDYHVLAAVRRPVPNTVFGAPLAVRISPLQLDVTQQDSIERARMQSDDIVGENGLAGLVNNAGIGIGGPVEYTGVAHLREQFDVNVFGVVNVVQAFLPLLRNAKGRIVNVSSMVARVPLPLFGPYSASKCALEALSDCLRVEIRRSGVTVSLIEPGLVDTPMQQKGIDRDHAIFEAIPAPGKAFYRRAANKRFETHEAFLRWAMPPERVAKVIKAVLETGRPRARYVVGRDARIFLLLRALLPRALLDRVLGRLMGV